MSRIPDQDAALEVLWLPFTTGALPWPEADGAVFLRARDGWPLRQRAWPGLVCEQSFRPQYEALQRSGWTVTSPEAAGLEDDGSAGGGLDAEGAGRIDIEAHPDATSPPTRHPLVLLLPPRQRDEARALFAQAVARCADGGVIVACMPNDEGAKSGESDLKRLAGLSGSLSKQHCRVFWTRRETATLDAALLGAWAALDAPRPIAGGRFLSRPGVFAWDRVDVASALLAAHLPTDLRGRAADLGAGWGYLSVELLARCPGVTALDLYEAEARSLALARRNLDATGTRIPVAHHWHDVTRGMSARYDVIVTNPPFHAQGRADRPDIGRAFIAAAADALTPSGRLWLVANRHLPYEQVLDARFGGVRTVAQDGGFKVIEAIRH